MLKRFLLVAPLAVAITLAACGGDDEDEGDGGAAAPAAGAATAQPAPAAVDRGDLPDAFPSDLIYPGAALESWIAVDDHRTLAMFASADSAEDILDFYADAFAALGLGDDGDRESAGGVSTYSVGDDETGSAAIVEEGAAENGENLISVGYYAE